MREMFSEIVVKEVMSAYCSHALLRLVVDPVYLEMYQWIQ